VNRAPHGPHRDLSSRFRRYSRTLPVGSVGYENATNEKDERLIWVGATDAGQVEFVSPSWGELEQRYLGLAGEGEA
jgi:hypothetical protein